MQLFGPTQLRPFEASLYMHQNVVKGAVTLGKYYAFIKEWCFQLLQIPSAFSDTLLLMEDHISSIPVVLILLSFRRSFHVEMWPLLTIKHENNFTLNVYVVVVGANQVKVLGRGGEPRWLLDQPLK